MIRRALAWLLITASAAALPASAQDISQRPMPRPMTSVSTSPAAQAQAPMVRPVPRPANANAASPIGVKPLPRPASIASAAAAESVVISPVTDTTPRPKPRPMAQVATAAAPSGGLARSPFPAPRPQGLGEALAAPQAQDSAASAPAKPNLIERILGAAKAPQSAGAQQDSNPAPKKGSVCGDRAIRGEKIKPITSNVKGCGVADPVRVTEVDGVKLSQAVTVECGTVTALKTWIDQAMRPAFGNRDVVELRIAAHYACRGRNNIKGARISEHGKGKALDIAGFIFSDGTEWTVKHDYNKQIRKAQKGACGIFGTTLGPGSDGYHEDHLHFDTARYRGGAYCR